ncbi:MAG: NACHT domain-containing protein, partial [Mycobacteriales bacterium]
MLGGPGSGKSTLAVLLLLTLLEQSTPHDPIPVLFSLASWDPARQHLSTWLADRLNQDYPRLRRSDFGRRAAARLIEARRVLPVLDGLDEMPPQRRSLALRRLNEALAGGCPVILTCRTSAYRSTLREADMLRHAAVVHANPVSSQEALSYLRTAISPQWHSRWQSVFAALADDPGCPLSIALASPLMIGLVRAVYRGADAQPARLLGTGNFPDVTAIENHLLDSLVPAAFPSAPP